MQENTAEEIQETDLPPVIEIQPENNTPETITPQSETVTPPTETKTETTPKRYSKTANFSPEEFELLNPVFEARVKSGITTDWNHFLRQMVDFTINKRHKEIKFGMPANTPTINFKNTFKAE